VGRRAAITAVLGALVIAGCAGSSATSTTNAVTKAQHTATKVVGSRYAGQKIEQGLQAGWNQYKFQDESIMAGQLAGAIRHEPTLTQVEAVEAAYMYASKLEMQQRLMPHDASHLIAAMEQQFPATKPILNWEVAWSR
jgi:hypothetical protein